MLKRGLIAGLANLIVMLVLMWLIGVVFPSVMQEYKNTAIFRPFNDPLMMVYFGYPFILLLTTCCTIYYNRITMLKTYLYVPEELDKKINFTAKTQNKSKAEVIRMALEKGITEIQQQGTASAQALLQIAEIGKKYNLQGPIDGSERMDEYLWTKNE